MATIAGSINQLRRRFLRLKGDRGLIPLQYEIRVSIGTLQGFLRGKNITVASLEAIEAWCERQERALARAGHTPPPTERLSAPRAGLHRDSGAWRGGRIEKRLQGEA